MQFQNYNFILVLEFISRFILFIRDVYYSCCDKLWMLIIIDNLKFVSSLFLNTIESGKTRDFIKDVVSEILLMNKIVFWYCTEFCFI